MKTTRLFLVPLFLVLTLAVTMLVSYANEYPVEIAIASLYLVVFLSFLFVKGRRAALSFLLLGLLPFTGFLSRVRFIFFDTMPQKNLLLFLPEVLLSILLVFVLIKSIASRRLFDQMKSPISKLLAVLLVIGVLQIFNPATNVGNGVRGFRFLLFTCPFFVAISMPISKRYINFLAKSIVTVAFLSAAYAIAQHHFGVPWFEQKWLAANPVTSMQLDLPSYGQGSYYFGNVLRVYGFTGQGPQLGQFLGLAFLIALSSLRGSPSLFRRLAWFLAAGVIGYGLLLTLSRGVIIAAFVAVILFSWLSWSKARLNFWYLALLLFLIALLFIFLLPDISTIYGNSTPEGKGLMEALAPEKAASFKGRLYFWSFLLRDLKMNPLGYGMGTTGSVGTSGSPIVDVVTDNEYIAIAIEMGLTGLFVYLLIVFKIFKILSRAYNQLSDIYLKKFIVVVLCYTVLYFLYGIVAANLESRLATFYLWTLVGLGFQLARLSGEVSQNA